ADEILQQKRLGDEVLDAVHQRAQGLFHIRAAGHEEKWNVARLLAAAEFFKKLTPVQTRHLVVARNRVGGLINDLKKRIRAMGSENQIAMRFEPFLNEVANEGVILSNEQANRFCDMRRHERGTERVIMFT